MNEARTPYDRTDKLWIALWMTMTQAPLLPNAIMAGESFLTIITLVFVQFLIPGLPLAWLMGILYGDYRDRHPRVTN